MGAGEKKFNVDECFKALPHRFPHRKVFSTVFGLVMVLFSCSVTTASSMVNGDRARAAEIVSTSLILAISSLIIAGVVHEALANRHRRRVLDWILREYSPNPPFSVLNEHVEESIEVVKFIKSNSDMLIWYTFSLVLLGNAFFCYDAGTAIVGLSAAAIILLLSCLLLNIQMLINSPRIIYEAIALHHGVDYSSKVIRVDSDGERRPVYKTRK